MIQNILPRQIMTKQAFENAIATVMVLGGSTNAVLHLIAMAKSVDVSIGLDDFQRISDDTPLIADLKPSGSYLMEDLYHVGGVPAVLKEMLQLGYLQGDCLTVTGKSIGENLETVKSLSEKQKIIVPFDKPIKANGHLQILYGNLAPEGAVAKITGKEGEIFEGPARIYENEFAAIKGIKEQVKKGEVIAQVGNSGLSTGPHLHYEIRKNHKNKSILPNRYLELDLFTGRSKL